MFKFIILGLDGAVPGIIDEYLEKGELPNIKRMKEAGCKGISLPCTSAVTPGNWASIASGSHAGTLGISDFQVHIPGTPLDQGENAFFKQMCQAELLWDALSRQGKKVATINYPSSHPITSPLHTAIGDNGSPTENSFFYMPAPARLLANFPVQAIDDREWDKEFEDVEIRPVSGWKSVPDSWKPLYEFSFEVKATNRDCGGCYEKTVGFFLIDGKIQAVVSAGRNAANPDCIMGIREWSSWQKAEFMLHGKKVEEAWRYRVVEADQEGHVHFYISVIYPTVNFSVPAEAGKHLYEKFGQYTDILNISKICTGWLDTEAMLDEFRQQGIWQAQAAVELTRNMGYTGVLSKWHAFDKFYHFLFDKIDPCAALYDGSQFEKYEEIHRQLLKITDEMAGILLDGADSDTTITVISDHGLMPSRKLAWVNNFLAKEGYIQMKEGPQGHEVIDFSRTKALMSPYVMIWINLKGRDPEGCVEPEEYDALCNEIVKKLRGWKDEETSEYVLSEVFRIEDGGFYGLWGARDGDIRIHTAPGYTLYRSKDITPDRRLVSIADGFYRGDHGSCKPTTKFGRGSEYAAFYICGNGIRKNHLLSRPIQHCDLVPTLCHIMGTEPPAQCEGAVLYDCLKK